MTTLDRIEGLAVTARDHLWMSYQAADGLVADEPVPIIVGSEGCWLVDSDGRRYLDGLAALEASALGHREPRLAAAITAQLEAVEFVDSFRYTTPATVELAGKLAQITPGNLTRTHFSAGGSEAVEAAVKIARQYQVLGGAPHRTKVISRFGAYHGCTYGAMAVDGHFYATRNYLYEPLPAFGRFAPAPYPYRCTLCSGNCNLECAEAVEQLIVREREETVAAVLLDPATSAIAVSIPPAGYLERVRAICDQHGVLLIADEVITGIGRTGRMFACEHWDVVPDIMTLSKGLSSGYVPIGATIVGEHVAERFRRPDGIFWHGHTFGGHPVACAAALETLRIVEEDDLVPRAAARGSRLRVGLERLMAEHPSIGEVRVLGLLCGVEIVLDRATRRLSDPPSRLGVDVRRACRDEGLVLAALEPGSTLLITPPLIISDEEIDELVRRLGRALARVESAWSIV